MWGSPGGPALWQTDREMSGPMRLLRPYATLALAVVASSGAGAAPSIEDLRACVASNVPERSSSLTLRLESRRRAGGSYVHHAQLYWKRSPEGLSQTLLCVTAPRDVEGLAYLVHEGQSGRAVWAYLPEEERVLRISTRAAARRARIGRTAMSYEDLRYAPLNVSEPETEETSDTPAIEGRPVSVARLSQPDAANALYDRVLSFIDQESCVPLRIELYEGEELRKLVTVDPASIRRVSEIWQARSMKIQDLKEDVETEILVEKLEVDTEMPDRIFAPEYLQRGHCPK